MATQTPTPDQMRRALETIAKGYEALWNRNQPPASPVAGPPLRRLLGYRELAEYLSISVSSAKLLAAAGEIPKVHVGGRVLFAQEDVDRYVERLKAER